MDIVNIAGGIRVFTNSIENDVIFYSESNSQNVHIGCTSNAPSMLKLSQSNVCFNGPLLMNSNDSSNAPGFTWDGDSNTGMYRAADNTIGFTCGGSNVMTLSNNTATFSNITTTTANILNTFTIGTTLGGPYFTSFTSTNANTKWGTRFTVQSINLSTAGYNNNPISLSIPTPGVYLLTGKVLNGSTITMFAQYISIEYNSSFNIHYGSELTGSSINLGTDLSPNTTLYFNGSASLCTWTVNAFRVLS